MGLFKYEPEYEPLSVAGKYFTTPLFMYDEGVETIDRIEDIYDFARISLE